MWIDTVAIVVVLSAIGILVIELLWAICFTIDTFQYLVRSFEDEYSKLSNTCFSSN
jgi:hypothetical protein